MHRILIVFGILANLTPAQTEGQTGDLLSAIRGLREAASRSEATETLYQAGEDAAPLLLTLLDQAPTPLRPLQETAGHATQAFAAR